ncbi:MAG: sigma-54 dependent transcriptional regulator [Myxococcaceae bacterium]
MSAVAVCGETPTLVDSGVALVKAAGQWEPLPLIDASAFETVAPLARGFLLMGERGPALARHLSERPKDKPLIVIGGEPLKEATCWLPSAPNPHLFSALLSQLLGVVKASGPSFRRKGDMIIGGSSPIQKVLRELALLTPSQAPVLITGESGTGKDLVAQAIHYCGPRHGKPMVALNCGAIPESLFEAELFGYMRGAFTGAVASRAGAFEAADGGTLFLDEIGELPLSMQVKLLRALETLTVTRLGSNEPKKVDVRLVAATNRDLEALVKQGRFREDLFYRVSVFRLHLPPLRDRSDDIPEIVIHQLSLIAEKERRPVPKLSPAALERVLGYPWPGNVRQLVNSLHRALVLSQGDVIDAMHFDLPDGQPSPLQPYSEAKTAFELAYYQRLLRSAQGNVSLAAKLAHKTRKEVYDALKRLSLAAEDYRS